MSVQHIAFSRLAAACLLVAAAGAARAASPVASYNFNGSLAAEQAGAPSLQAIDPQGRNDFEQALVGGSSRSVYRWSGDGQDASTQAGLALDASSLLSDLQTYSLAMRFEFSATASTGGGWRRLVDTQGRQSDNGFYLAPTHQLQVVQLAETNNAVLATGSTAFSTPGFHDVFLSVARTAGGQQVRAWLDGVLEIDTSTTTLGLAGNGNPGGLLVFFADNLAAGAQLEYADGRIAALALYDGAFSPSAVPEPAAGALLAAGLLVLAWRRRAAAAGVTCP